MLLVFYCCCCCCCCLCCCCCCCYLISMQYFYLQRATSESFKWSFIDVGQGLSEKMIRFVFGHHRIRTSVCLWECVCVCVCDYAKYIKKNINDIERWQTRQKRHLHQKMSKNSDLSNFSFSVRKTIFYKEQWQVA